MAQNKWRKIGFSTRDKKNLKYVPKWVQKIAFRKIHKHGIYYIRGKTYLYKVYVKSARQGGRYYAFYRRIRRSKVINGDAIKLLNCLEELNNYKQKC